jgi:signal transduction histidine kinase
VAELRRSRQRLVTAQDAARREFERGLEWLGQEVDGIIRSLRDLARGLRPPVLESDGLVSALRAGVRGLPVDVEVAAGWADRFTPAVEASVYFVCLDAITNAVRHGKARHVRVSVRYEDGWLRFRIEDDGHGFDLEEVEGGRGLGNLDDRIEIVPVGGIRMSVMTTSGSAVATTSSSSGSEATAATRSSS